MPSYTASGHGASLAFMEHSGVFFRFSAQYLLSYTRCFDLCQLLVKYLSF